MATISQEQEVYPGQKRKRDEDGNTSDGEPRDGSSSSTEDEASDLVSAGKRRQQGSRRQRYSMTTSPGNEKVSSDCLPYRKRCQHFSNKTLTKLHFACPLPQKPSPPAPQFCLAQGHKLMFTVTYRDSKYIFIVMALGKELQKRELNWPLRESFVLVLHKTKDRQGRPMEADCPGPGKRCCSLEVDKNEIKKFDYIEEGMLHVILKLNPKTILPSHPALTKKLPVQ